MAKKKEKDIPISDMDLQAPISLDDGAPVQMTSEEMKADLEKDMADVKKRKSTIDHKRTVSAASLKEMKTGLIRSLFDSLKAVGVDPDNLESISDFLKRLYEQEPDLYELFDAAFNGLMGDQIPGGSPEGSEEAGPMPGGPMPGGPMPGGPMPGGPMPGPMPGGPMPGPMPGGPMPPGPSGPMPPGPEEEGGGGLMEKFGSLRNKTFRQ